MGRKKSNQTNKTAGLWSNSHRPLRLLRSVLGAPHVWRCTPAVSYDANVQFPAFHDFEAWNLSVMAHARIQRGRGQGVRTPLKSHKATNVGPSSASQRNAISTAFHLLAEDGPLLVSKEKQNKKKTLSELDPPLTKHPGSTHMAYPLFHHPQPSFKSP